MQHDNLCKPPLKKTLLHKTKANLHVLLFKFIHELIKNNLIYNL